MESRNDGCLDDRLSKGVVAIGMGAVLLVAGNFFGKEGVECIVRGANQMILGQNSIIHYVGGIFNLIMGGISYGGSVLSVGYGIRNID